MTFVRVKRVECEGERVNGIAMNGCASWRGRRTGRGLAFGLLASALLAGCGWFDDEERLPGKRVPVREVASPATGDVLASVRQLPQVRGLSDWTQTNGNSAHNSGHLDAPSNPTLAWSQDAGVGTSEDSAITGAPIVVGGVVYVLDAAAELSAFDARSGGLRWQVSLVPNEDEEGEEGFGGGLAADGGKLFVATGFGEVLALSPASGEILWRRAVGAPFRAAPAAIGGLVVAVTRDSQSFGFDAEDGTVRWRHQGVAPDASYLGGASPAIVGQIALVPYGSGELVALDAVTGRQIWSAVLTGGRRGLARAAITDLTGDPVAVGPYVISANQSGRTAAFEGRTGRRVWTRQIGTTLPIWPAGDTLYMLSDTSALTRLDAQSGVTLWEVELPAYEDPEDLEDPISYSGPVLIGGRVLLSDSLGNLWSFDGLSGQGGVSGQVPGGAISGLVAAGGMLYTLSEDAVLHAYR